MKEGLIQICEEGFHYFKKNCNGPRPRINESRSCWRNNAQMAIHPWQIESSYLVSLDFLHSSVFVVFYSSLFGEWMVYRYLWLGNISAKSIDWILIASGMITYINFVTVHFIFTVDIFACLNWSLVWSRREWFGHWSTHKGRRRV